MRRFEWADDPSVDFHLGYGDWIRVLTVDTASRSSGWSSCGNPGHDSGPATTSFTAEWAERWPAEEIWKARKAA